jgi:hypothetical protein
LDASIQLRRLPWAVLWLLSAPAIAGDSLELGRRLYHEGIGVDGQPVTAMVQGDVPVSGTQLACTGCHKRSGLGASEGGKRALPVTGPVLFGPRSAQPANMLKGRPSYTDQTLLTAIEAGHASDSRLLDVLMPRYRLSEADRSALTTYLRSLGTSPAPGVGTDTVELATIVSDSAQPAEREAVTAVLQRFAQIKDSGTRNEQRRAEASRRHVYGERHARSFRQWHVSVWTLTGSPSGWPEQLEQLYARNPPFAVISGATGDHWSVVDDFCERKEMPCVLPVTAVPQARTGRFYSLYYSAGAQLDARVTAGSFAQDALASNDKVVVVHTGDERGRVARDAFAASLPVEMQGRVVYEEIAVDRETSPAYWQELLRRETPGALVAWLAPAQLAGLAATDAKALPHRIYTADSFTDWTKIRASRNFEERVLHVYPFSLAAQGLAQFPREQVWLKSQGLDGLDTRAAAEALFACHAAGEAMQGMADNYSRDYLMETLEHMLDGTNMTTLFPVATLGTGQRQLVKGAYVVKLASSGQGVRYLSSGWIQP